MSCRHCGLSTKCVCENSLEHTRYVHKDSNRYPKLRKITTKLSNFSPKTLANIERVKNESTT